MKHLSGYNIFETEAGFPKWGWLAVGDNLGKMAKNCMII